MKRNEKILEGQLNNIYQNLDAYSISLNLSQANVIIEQIHTQVQKDIHRIVYKNKIIKSG